MERKHSIAVRVTEREYQRLQELGRRTRRSVSAIMRELLARAELASEPELRLRGQNERRTP